MKAYTDLEQSKKLAEILPLESADMHYVLIDSEKDLYSAGLDKYIGILPHHQCWSLAALLSVYPMVVGRDMGMYCCWQNSKNLHSRHYDNPIDACYEMIIKLHKLNLL